MFFSFNKISKTREHIVSQLIKYYNLLLFNMY